MKLYEKIDNNGVSHVMPYNKIVIIKDGMQIFNPTKEMLLEDGWKEHVLATPKVSDNDIIEMEKEALIDDIYDYDSSSDVNIFYVGDMPVWLDKATRAGLMLRFQAEQAIGKSDTSLWYNGFEFKLPLTNAMQMLYAVEVYASACYDNTQRHIHNVNIINDIDSLKEYNYKDNYPEKLRF